MASRATRKFVDAMIRRVHIEGYKSLKKVDLELAPLAVIFGPNAAGKSNLHDALSLLSRLATTKNVRDAFDLKVHRGTALEAFSYGPGGLEELLKMQSARLTIEADVELSRPVIEAVETRVRQLQEGLPGVRPRQRVKERFLRYRVTVEIVPETGVLRIVDEYLAALNLQGQPSRNRPPFIELQQEKLHLRLEGQAHPTYHDLGLDYTLVSSQLYPPHFPHIAALREELSRWYFYYLEPDVMRRDTPLQDVGVRDHDGSE
ncbi:MAG: AAA family ATPase [Chloroflexi bacterium]|nr:AAA family ATPase [Chloroflexota bacterium]